MSGRNLTLVLHGAWRLNQPQRQALIRTVRRGLEPLARRASKRLSVSLPMRSAPGGDLNLYFEMGERRRRACELTILGECGSLFVNILGHLDLRVCGTDARNAPRRFITTDDMLGRALGNTALHELGHFIANLDHSRVAGNYMTTLGPPRARRTVRSQRQFWAGRHHWTSDQERWLVEGLRTGNYLGDIQVN